MKEIRTNKSNLEKYNIQMITRHGFHTQTGRNSIADGKMRLLQ